VEGGGRGEDSYDHTKAWSSVNHLILSGVGVRSHRLGGRVTGPGFWDNMVMVAVMVYCGDQDGIHYQPFRGSIRDLEVRQGEVDVWVAVPRVAMVEYIG
jgi:hypothetical protein